MTAKLHHAVLHVVDQLACQGPGAHYTEYWIERMIWYLKLYLKDRVRDNGEIIFAKDHLLLKSAQTCRCIYPQHCLTLAERRGAGRAMEFPVYDKEVNGAMLLGPHVASGLSAAESAAVVPKLPEVLKASDEWYCGKGWPHAKVDVLSSMLERGSLVLDKFLQASLPCMDVISCTQDVKHHSTDNTWVYVVYKLPNGESLPCVGHVEYFVRCRATSGGVPVFDATGCIDDAAAEALKMKRNGQCVLAVPLKFAVCKLWLAEVCDADAIGCRKDDICPGLLPDLLCVSNMAEANQLPSDYDGSPLGARDSRRFFGEYLVDIAEIGTQLISSNRIVMPGSSKANKTPRSQFFMTCSKMSGK